MSTWRQFARGAYERVLCPDTIELDVRKVKGRWRVWHCFGVPNVLVQYRTLREAKAAAEAQARERLLAMLKDLEEP